MISKELLEEAVRLKETLIFNRRYLHSHAETGFDLENTCAFVEKALVDMGYEPIHCGKSGLIALQEINARELAMDDRAVLTVGTMHAGTAANAIPDIAVIGGSLRTFDEDVRSFIKERMVQLAEGIAKSFRAEAKVIWGSGCPTLVNDKELSICAPKYVRELLGENRTFFVLDLNKMSDTQKAERLYLSPASSYG